jgi:hypothetical protein
MNLRAKKAINVTDAMVMLLAGATVTVVYVIM